MTRRNGRGFSSAEKTELWDRWQRGESLKSIGRVFGTAGKSLKAIVVVDLFPTIAARRDPAFATTALAAGVEPMGTRGDLTGDRGPALDPIDGVVAKPVALDGEPGSSPQWRL